MLIWMAVFARDMVAMRISRLRDYDSPGVRVMVRARVSDNQ